MGDNFTSININNFIDEPKPEYGVSKLQDIISSFSCPSNVDVEKFLRKNAVHFTRKKQSVTYCVFNDLYEIAGYYSLTIKPVIFKGSVLSNTARKVIERVSKYDSQLDEYSASAYLIAQLGKNLKLPAEKRIPGKNLLEFAVNSIKEAQKLVGGTIVFLECENHKKLLDFYELNGFRAFSSRTVENTNTEIQVLNQLYRLI